MRTIFLFFISLIAWASVAQQKKLIEPKEDIIAQAKLELNAAMQAPGGELYLWKTENNIKGEYTVDITIREKGDVASVFMVSSEGTEIKMQNQVKDRIRLFGFNFKMPKGKTYKFQYIFRFDEGTN
jgi:hypothetical protein